MSYSEYPHRGNLADSKILRGEFYEAAIMTAYENEVNRFGMKLSKLASAAMREYTQHNSNGPGTQSNAPYIHMKRYVEDRILGIPAPEITDVFKEYQKYAHSLCQSISVYTQPIHLSPLYRGMKVIPDTFKSKSVGDSVVIDTIISASSYVKSSINFCDSDGLLMIIKDAYGIPIDNNVNELEFLLAPGSQFVIDDIYRIDYYSDTAGLYMDNITVFEVSMVSNVNKLDLLVPKKRWGSFKAVMAD